MDSQGEQQQRIGQAPNETAPNRERWAVFADYGLLVFASLVSAFLLANLIAFHYGRDQGIYAVVADAIVHGKAPYRDAWDFKPPGIFFLYAFARALLGKSMHSVRVIEAVSFVSLVCAFGIFSRRHVGSYKPGLLGGALAVVTHVQMEFWHTGQPESFGAVAIAWALVCATYEPAEPRARARMKQHMAWAGAGALYTFAALLKPPLGGGFLVSLSWLCWHRWKAADTLRERLVSVRAPVVAFTLGAAVPLSFCAMYFLSKGAWHDLYETLFVFTPHYTQLSFRSEWLVGFVFLAVEQWVFTFSAFNVLGLALLLALPRLSTRELEGASHIAAVVAFQLIGIALQAKFFPYHYGAALPFAGLLAGWGFWKLWLRARRTPVGIASIALLVYVLHDARTATRDLEDPFWARCSMRFDALVHPDERGKIADRLYRLADFNARSERFVAAWVAASTPPGSILYIWGFDPEIYALSERASASRYIYNVVHRVPWKGRDATRRELLTDLMNTAPSAIVIQHNDVFPVVTGDTLDSAGALRSFPELSNFLTSNYRLVTAIDYFDIYFHQ